MDKKMKLKMRMPKIKAIALLCLLSAFFLSACQKNKEVGLKPGVYALQDNESEFPGDFTITLHSDGTFQYYETPISSYIGMGHYSIEDDMVTFKEDVDGCSGDVNYYRIVDGELLFKSKDSSNYRYVPLEDGAAFEWKSEI